MLYGTAYYPDYFPEADWPRDLDAMRAAGLTSVRILEFAWCWYQPRPDVFRFEPLDRFLDLCLARGLRVCLCTPTATPPPWFFQKHPDCRLIDVSGRPCYSHRHMVCWQHPGALAEALRTITALAARYAAHPAVWGWQIDNEPNYAEKVADCYDFNPHALAAGQAWLRARYASFEALNAAWFNQFWSQSYDDWSQIWVTHRPQTNPASMVDFLRHREHALASFVHTQRDLLRRLCPAQKIGVNIPEVGVHFSTVIGQDYWAQAAGLDWVGTDLYAATADRAADLRALRYSTDLLRSAVASASPAAEFLIAETQGGPHLRTWECGFAGYPWDASYLRDSVHAYAERGARQVWFFLWRPVPGGQEIGMNATTDLDGGPTEFTREIARLAAEDAPALAATAAAYATRPLALVHYSQDTHRFLAFHNQLPAAAKSQLGCHAWLDTQGFRVAYLTDADLEKPLPDAALLVLPESHLLSDVAQQNLLAWASAPSAVAEPRSGFASASAFPSVVAEPRSGFDSASAFPSVVAEPQSGFDSASVFPSAVAEPRSGFDSASPAPSVVAEPRSGFDSASPAAAVTARRLILGPHTGLLDERAQLRGPSRLPLWTALGLRPGPWRDMGETTPHRVFTPAAPSPAAIEPPAPLRPRPNVLVYRHRWTDALATSPGAHALPAA